MKIKPISCADPQRDWKQSRWLFLLVRSKLERKKILAGFPAIHADHHHDPAHYSHDNRLYWHLWRDHQADQVRKKHSTVIANILSYMYFIHF